MIRILKCGEVSNDEIFARSEPAVDVEAIVADILADVRANGDKALYAYEAKFDRAELTALGVDGRSAMLADAVATCVVTIARSVFSGSDAVLTVSSLAHSRYGIKEDVCLSLPCILGPKGILREVDPPLLPDELKAVQNSAKVLRATLDSVGL